MPEILPSYHDINPCSRRSHRTQVTESLYLTLAECWERCQEQLCLYITLRFDMPTKEDARVLEERITKLSAEDDRFSECFGSRLECCTQLVTDTVLIPWLQALLNGDDKLPKYQHLFQQQQQQKKKNKQNTQVHHSAATIRKAAAIMTPPTSPNQKTSCHTAAGSNET